MNNMLGVLKVRIRRGNNLPVRDTLSSDPYVIVTMGQQTLKTRVVKDNCNPVWNEELTLSVKDVNQPIKLVSPPILFCLNRTTTAYANNLVVGTLGRVEEFKRFFIYFFGQGPKFDPDFVLKRHIGLHLSLQSVYDKDTFTPDDSMGEALIDIKPCIEAKNMGLVGLPVGTKLDSVQPSKDNYLAHESAIIWSEGGKITQDMILRLRNVECGEIEVQIEWIDLSGGKGKGPLI